jgi:hypothetical protein
VPTTRQQAIRREIRALAPLAPAGDIEPVYAMATSARLRALPPSAAAWLALTSHVRHAHTDYDALLAEGYDRDAARHFVLAAMEDVLSRWGCRKPVGWDEEG